MNYKERRLAVQDHIYEILSTVEQSHTVKVLKSNLPTLPMRNVLVLDRLLDVTQKAEGSLEECIQFCRESGFLDGPIKLRQTVTKESKGSLYSITLPHGNYLCLDINESAIYISDDVNGTLPHKGSFTEVSLNSRVGAVEALNAAIFKLLDKEQITDRHAIYSAWVRAKANTELESILSDRYIRARTVPRSEWPRIHDATEAIPVATLYHDWLTDNPRKHACILRYYCGKTTTTFYLENPATDQVRTIRCYQFVDPTHEEVMTILYSVVFIRGATRIEFAGH